MERYKFKEGEIVYHIENLKQRMTVNRLLRQMKMIPTEEIDPETNKFKKIEKIFFNGLECYWWDKDEKYQKQKFHSKLLIPAHIVDMGDKSIKVFMESK